MHITLEADMTPEPRQLPFSHFRDSQDGTIKIFLHSKRIDTFFYEVLLVHILSCVGIKGYKCCIQLFEAVSDICILQCFIYSLNRKLDVGLKIHLDEKKIRITLEDRAIYETDIL